MYDLWLIQRGTFKDIRPEDIEGMDSLIRWSYMGSAEFEFGALPESLRRIVSGHKGYEFVEIPEIKDKNGDTLRVYCKTSEREDAVAAANHLATVEHGYKELAGVKSYIDGLFNLYITGNFWWDIKNDFFLMFGEEKQQLVSVALNKLKDKWL